jgi:hypothetical protein
MCVLEGGGTAVTRRDSLVLLLALVTCPTDPHPVAGWLWH